MTTHTRILLLAALLALSNLLWWAAYRSLDQAYMQESGLRDEADHQLRYWQDCSEVDAPIVAECVGRTNAGRKALLQPAPNR
jgi:cell division inhibitor SulA